LNDYGYTTHKGKDCNQSIIGCIRPAGTTEAKLQNAEQLRREIQIKQLKYCGLNQVFTSGTMEEKKMLLSILVRRVEVRQGYELNIQLTPGFEQFLDGLIEMR